MTISDEKNIDKVNSKDEVFIFPTSYGQKRMWFLDQFEPESPYYNIPVAFKIKGKFDIKLFTQTIEIIINRHESLRTTFSNIKGQPFQVISQSGKIEIPIFDLSKSKNVNEDVKQLATKEARAPFNLSTGPLFRVKILKIYENEIVVLITMHHIISDGWSMGILVNEITNIYPSLISNKKIDLPELELQYADYSEWQNNYLKGEVLEKQLQYWKNKLGNCNSLLELPTDRNRKPIYTNNGSSIERIISSEIINGLQKISNSENASLFMMLIAAFNVLLSRYSGQKEINVGTPIANRIEKETEKIIGLFINTLVINTKLDDGLTFRELLKQVRNTNLEAYEHQDLPFEMLVDALQPERNMSYSPLFQVMFILQNNPVSATNINEIEITMIDVDMGTSTSDITYSISPGENGASCSIEYSTDLFDENTMQRMFDDFEELLREVINNPNQKISGFNLLNKKSKKLVLEDWNSRNILYPTTNGIHTLFERWVEITPNSIAVVDDFSKITYCELNKKANRLANYLLYLNLNKSLPIGISQSKSINLIASVLGVLKAGYAYLPLDPTYPSDRLNYMIDDSSIELLITDKENTDIFSSFPSKIIIDEDTNIENYTEENLNLKINENDLAYIIYTSGSTGKAKGTMIQHNSLINIYLGWEQDYCLLTDVKNHLQMASFSFDVFGGDWTRALCSGGKLVLVKREKLLEADELYKLIINENIEIAEFVPAVLRNLVSYINEKSFDLKMFKVLIAGSDIWYVREYKEFKKLISDQTRLINSFGLTETAIDSTFFEDKELNLPDERLVPIGRPFPNIHLYILDENFKILPIGAKGELYIGGVSLARGYYKKPHLTAERFLPNPFSKISGDRLYKTGDLARYLSDGNIEFLGRADHQIKMRGFRIELGEIETSISEHEKVKESIVLAKEDKNGEKKLVAYINCKEGKTIEITELRDFVSEKVPDYMVPSVFIFMDKFPLTPNGKVDRKALPEPNKEELQKAIEIDFVAPRNKIEIEICKIWEEILSIEKVGIRNNFFLLGGHSLLATQVISRLKSELNIELPLRVIFEKPTIEEIAFEIEKLEINQPETSKEIKIERRKTNQNIPLSFAQERLWFLDQFEPNSPFYNIPESYRIKGKINTEILNECFNIIIDRHEILRTYFSSNDGTPFQVIQEKLEINIPIIDLSNVTNSKVNINQLIDEEARTPLSITQLPLFRIKIIKLGDEDLVFLMTIHHIISDDWSSRVIVQELGLSYESLSLKLPNPLLPLQIQYADYSIWQRNWLKDEILKTQIEYWKNKLTGIPSLLELPIDHARPNEQTFNGDFIPFILSDDLSKKINIITQQEGITVFMFLLAAYKVLLYKLSGQNDIVVGTPNANRNKKEIESLVGFFVNTLALRTNFYSELSIKELFTQIKETTLQAYAHQELPFEYIVDILKPERNLSHSPIFQVMFVYQTVKGKQSKGNENLSIEPIETHTKTAKFDLTLFMIDTDEEISGAFEFNSDLFEKHTIKKFINYFETILKTIIENISLKVNQVSLLNIDEQKNLLIKLNATEAMPLIEDFINVKLSKVAISNFNKTAIAYNNVNYSFGDLEETSNRLVNYLISLNIKSEDIISICLPRSFNLIYSLLAVLKSGAAYLPIDPNYPLERIQYIIEDSKSKLIITDSQNAKLFDNRKNKIIILDQIDNLLQKFSIDLPIIKLYDYNICYVIYTSGSTGKPKGTLLTHKAFLNYLSWAIYAYPFNHENGSIVHSSISFDATITSIYPPLLQGKKIVLMKESDDLDELKKTINLYSKFSILKITPAHLELLTQQISVEEAKNVSQAMVIGGENLTSKQIDFWQTYSSETLLFNEYGPTEAVVGCIVYESSKYRGIGSIPIGKVIPNMKIYILDQNLSQIPIGVVGELYLGGISLARGYLSNPQMTAEKFIPNPFSDFEGERIYKTGDLVKILPDGNLLFIGRVDDQVKVRGYRIELGEIESRLNEIDEVKECVLDIKDFGANDKRIVAYIVQQTNCEINIDKIKKQLKSNLPNYMIPSNFILIEKIPLTFNGKVDRKKLATQT
ncbi:MAG: amino acid adenylation domain-containing protein, partial [Melioribacteraceae bacterium]